MRSLSGVFFSFLLLLALPVFASAQDLIQAVRDQDESAVRRLVADDPSLVHVSDERDCTPLHFAVAENRADLVEFLLEHGADPDAPDSDGDAPLTWAALNGLDDMLALLLEKGVEVDPPNNYGRTPLLQVARETGDADMARALLEHGANPDAKDRFGATSLNLAAWRGFSGVVDALLDHGADLGVGGPLAKPNTEYAADKGLDRLFTALLEAEVDLDIRTENGGSLLHSASNGGSVEIVTLLLDREFRIDGRDRYGWTPLHYAAERGRIEVTELLLSRGADINAATTGGYTPLFLTQTFSKEEEARLLEAHGALLEAESAPAMRGPWLGQEAPGSKPEVFAPDIVSSARFEHGTITFSPDGREAFWESSFMPDDTGYSRGRILTSRMEDGRWTRPGYASFSTSFFFGDDVPFFHPNGERIFFLTGRRAPGESDSRGERIWYVDRTDHGWGEPVMIEGGPNTVSLHWQFSVAANGNIYHSTNMPEALGGAGLFVSRLVDGAYLPPETLGPNINGKGELSSPFIAPDESYLIFTGRGLPENLGATDLYISFKDPKGAWTIPLNMAERVNTPTYDMCPHVSADGRFLFWNSRPEGGADNFWMAADIIDELRTRILGEEAGVSRSY